MQRQSTGGEDGCTLKSIFQINLARENNLNSNCNCFGEIWLNFLSFNALKGCCLVTDNERQLKFKRKMTKNNLHAHYFIQFAGEH